jgi:hypothetical protein
MLDMDYERLLNRASLLVTPTLYKEGVLYPQIPTYNSNGDFSVTRATTATRVNAAGLVELVPYNLVQYSEQFENALWTKLSANVTANSAISPSGVQNADTLTADGTFNTHSIIQSGSAINGVTYTHSIYAKKGTNNFIQLAGTGAIYTGNNVFANFDLNNGVVGSVGAGATATITSVGNGWYRCTMTATATSTATGSFIFPCLVSSATSTRAEPNTLSTSVFLWGAQLVEGTSALDYQATETRLNIPRLDYSLGSCPNILLEPQRTNLALRSEEFDNATWVKDNSSVTANSTISPSGIQNADTYTGSGGITISRFVYQLQSVVSGTQYTISIYAKKNTNNFIQLLGGTTSFGVNAFANFDLNNGVVGTIGSAATARIENVGNGWYRCSITAPAIATIMTAGGLYSLITSATSVRGEANTLSTSVFLWGAQLEAGAYPTSYIQTSSASVTRNGDALSRTNIFTNGLITASGGTWFVDLRNNVPLIRDAIARFGVGDTSVLNSNSLVISNLLTTSSRFILYKVIAGNYTSIFTSNANTTKLAIKWNGSTADVFANGVKVVTATTFTTTNMDFLGISGGDVPKFINSMALFPTPLTDGEMSMLTSGVYTPALAYAQLGLVSESPACLDSSVNALL